MGIGRRDRAPVARIGFVLAAAALLAAALVGTAAGHRSGRTCFGKHATIRGTQHGDSLRGTNGRDVIIAFGGNDHIRSRQGKDYVCAGPGNDVIHGAEGVNYMNGGPGDDWLDGRRGPGNVSIGSGGDDKIQAEGKASGGPGNDEIETYGYQPAAASPFPDRTSGGGGRDKITGCASGRVCVPPGNGEVLKGGGANDAIRAGDGNDHVFGNSGNDTLHGEDGNDAIDGGSGTDVCDQGAGTGSQSHCP